MADVATWPQLYDPFGNRILSTAVSALPVVTLFFVLVARRKKAPHADAVHAPAE